MGLQKRTRDIIDNSVEKRTEFHRGNVSGKWFRGGQTPLKGRMSFETYNKFISDIGDEEVYCLFSYHTVMAWYVNGKWYMPDEKYSSSTTTHQGAFRYAIHMSGKEVKSV